MMAISHVSGLIKGIDEGDKANKAMKELESLVEATKAADQNGPSITIATRMRI